METKSLEEIFQVLNTKPISRVLLELNSNSSVETLNKALENKDITNFLLNYSIQNSVILEAKESYNQMLNPKREYKLYADHILMPECLAYAIQRKTVFTKEELDKIPFDHGDTLETYPKIYGKDNLINKLREEILTYKEFPKIDYDSSFCYH